MNVMKFKGSLIIVAAVLGCWPLISYGQLQDNDLEIQSEVIFHADPNLNATFSKYQTVNVNPKVIYQQINDPNFSNEVSWEIAGQTVRMALYPHDIRNADYQLQVQTADGVKTMPKSPNTTYRGWNLDTGGGEVRLSITPQRISGFVTTKEGKELYLQPVQDFGTLGPNLSVIYSADDVIKDPNHVCGSHPPS